MRELSKFRKDLLAGPQVTWTVKLKSRLSCLLNTRSLIGKKKEDKKLTRDHKSGEKRENVLNLEYCQTHYSWQEAVNKMSLYFLNIKVFTVIICLEVCPFTDVIKSIRGLNFSIAYLLCTRVSCSALKWSFIILF